MNFTLVNVPLPASAAVVGTKGFKACLTPFWAQLSGHTLAFRGDKNKAILLIWWKTLSHHCCHSTLHAMVWSDELKCEYLARCCPKGKHTLSSQCPFQCLCVYLGVQRWQTCGRQKKHNDRCFLFLACDLKHYLWWFIQLTSYTSSMEDVEALHTIINLKP